MPFGIEGAELDGVGVDVPSTASVMEFGSGNVFSMREMIGKMIRKCAK